MPGQPPRRSAGGELAPARQTLDRAGHVPAERRGERGRIVPLRAGDLAAGRA